MPSGAATPLDGPRAVAAILAGSWRRESPGPAGLSSRELVSAVPILFGTGAAALGWRQLEKLPPLSAIPAAEMLHRATKMLALEDARNQRAVERAVATLNAAEIEPLLVKGWAVARHYPETYLRPYGDVDLCAPPGRHAEARACLAKAAMPRAGRTAIGNFVIDCGPDAKPCTVDLHRDFRREHIDDVEGLFERSHTVRIGAAKAKLPSAEDHLRFVITHFLRHGGARPLWLCDIAALVEAAGDDFDWALCLGNDRRSAEWVATGITLAADLLGCDVSRVPATARADRVPEWLVDVMLREWTRVNAVRRTGAMGAPFPSRFSDARPWFSQRCANPIAATVACRGSFGDGWQRAYQAADFTARAAGYCWRLSRAATRIRTRLRHRAAPSRGPNAPT
ncbi:MAG: nucleotidyltransferase family protein [Gammaproteobacteria bacterium]|nr:nucleotidyltransferase family protein [Gammaproteobacteria bacterium]